MRTQNSCVITAGVRLHALRRMIPSATYPSAIAAASPITVSAIPLLR